MAAWTPWFLAFVLRAKEGSLTAVALGGLALGLEGYCGPGEQTVYAVVLAAILVVAERAAAGSGRPRRAYRPERPGPQRGGERGQ